jgi:hypothetical protein
MPTSARSATAASVTRSKSHWTNSPSMARMIRWVLSARTGLRRLAGANSDGQAAGQSTDFSSASERCMTNAAASES